MTTLERPSLASLLFERGGLRAVFEHPRNAVVATLIAAAGLGASKSTVSIGPLELMNPPVADYLAAAVGYLLIVLNCIDGLRRMPRLRWHLALQIALGAAYLLVWVRIIQLTIMLRAGYFGWSHAVRLRRRPRTNSLETTHLKRPHLQSTAVILFEASTYTLRRSSR